MDEFWTTLLYVEIVFFSVVVAVLPQITYSSFLKNKNIKTFVKYIYDNYDFRIINVELVVALAKRNKVEEKYLRVVFLELLNVAYADVSKKEIGELSDGSNKIDSSDLLGNETIGHNSEVIIDKHNYTRDKFEHFKKLLKHFDFEAVFLNLPSDINIEIHHIKNNLSLEHKNTLYRLAERVQELTGQKRKRDRINLSLTIYGIVLTTLGALVTFSPYIRNLLTFFQS